MSALFKGLACLSFLLAVGTATTVYSIYQSYFVKETITEPEEETEINATVEEATPKVAYIKGPYLEERDFVNVVSSDDQNTVTKLPPSYFLSTRGNQNTEEWNKRVEIVKKKVDSNKKLASDGFFTSITSKDDVDILQKVKEGCDEYYKSVKPTDDYTLFSKAKWVEGMMFCGRGRYGKSTSVSR